MRAKNLLSLQTAVLAVLGHAHGQDDTGLPVSEIVARLTELALTADNVAIRRAIDRLQVEGVVVSPGFVRVNGRHQAQAYQLSVMGREVCARRLTALRGLIEGAVPPELAVTEEL